MKGKTREYKIIHKKYHVFPKTFGLLNTVMNFFLKGENLLEGIKKEISVFCPFFLFFQVLSAVFYWQMASSSNIIDFFSSDFKVYKERPFLSV